METAEVDGDAAYTAIRQAEMLESRLEHLVATWGDTVRIMSPAQTKDLIEGLRDAALEHRLALQDIMKRCRTKKY